MLTNPQIRTLKAIADGKSGDGRSRNALIRSGHLRAGKTPQKPWVLTPKGRRALQAATSAAA